MACRIRLAVCHGNCNTFLNAVGRDGETVSFLNWQEVKGDNIANSPRTDRLAPSEKIALLLQMFNHIGEQSKTLQGPSGANRAAGEGAEVQGRQDREDHVRAATSEALAVQRAQRTHDGRAAAARAGAALTPLYEALCKFALSCPALHIDETPVRTLNLGQDWDVRTLTLEVLRAPLLKRLQVRQLPTEPAIQKRGRR